MSVTVKPIVVQKYGGVCLATPEKIKAVAESVSKLANSGHRVVVVVSAMGPTTDELIALAHKVSPNPNQRELDMLLTAGERISMSLMSMALTDLGQKAISFTGSQAGILTTHSYSNAKIIDVKPIRVEEELSKGKIVVLAGFQGVNPESKEIMTLGRGGTDTSAVAMASKLKAIRCEIIKEVDGVCSADPRIIPEAKPIRSIHIDALSDICFWGAKVLQYRCVELARRSTVPLVLKKWGEDVITTQVSREPLKGVPDMEQSEVLSINSHPEVDHLQINAANLNEGFIWLKSFLKDKDIPHPQILASAHEGGALRMMYTAEGETLRKIRKELVGQTQAQMISETQSTVTVTASGLYRSDRISDMLHMLFVAGVKPHKILTNPMSVTFSLPTDKRETALKVLHQLV